MTRRCKCWKVANVFEEEGKKRRKGGARLEHLLALDLAQRLVELGLEPGA